MLNTRIIAPKGYQEMKRSAFSVLLAPLGAASILKEGYVVSGCARASQYAERYGCVL